MFPCVAIIGPRQCGKTTLLHTLGDEWKYFDLERGADMEVIAHDPDLFLRINENCVAIDEAQILPALFPALRVAIDSERARKGRFVITGSSSPDLMRSLSESLAGRLAVIEMSPLMWAEVHGCTSSSLIAGIAQGATDAPTLIKGLSPRASLPQALDYWFRGGYPEPWITDSPRFSDRWTDQYIQTYLQRDVARLFPALDHNRFRLFIRMLGGLSGQVINIAEVARALGVAQPTARDYFEIAHGTFVWRRLPAFHRNTAKRVVKHAKGYVRDAGLLHHLIRVPDLDGLQGHPQVAASWEGLVIEEIIRQLNVLAVPIDASFYRTAAGAEVDLVCEGPFGVIPFEIKRGQRVDLRDLRGLRDFISEQDCPVGVVINNDTEPRIYEERILGVPFVYL
ncbi:MAG: ATP-binding protein [Verrucomicrobia bacterium]|nr:ATP-binding protein [Verrucomicrobiota bacterium]